MGCSSGSGPATGVSYMADRKDMEEADRASGGVSVRVFYLFYLRLVQLPHQLVRWVPSSRWWAETNRFRV